MRDKNITSQHNIFVESSSPYKGHDQGQWSSVACLSIPLDMYYLGIDTPDLPIAETMSNAIRTSVDGKEIL